MDGSLLVMKQNKVLKPGSLRTAGSILNVLFGIMVLLGLGVCISGTLFDLPWRRMLVLSVLLAGAIIWVYLGLRRLEDFLRKYYGFLLPAVILLYTTVLLSLVLGVHNVAQTDQASVIAGAKYFAGMTKVMDWRYFARCNNNIIPAWALGQVYRLSKLLGFWNPVHFAIAVNAVLVMLNLFCVFRICLWLSAESYASAFSGVLLMMGYPAVIGHTQSNYTDAMSLAIPLMALCMWIFGIKSRKIRYMILAGVIWGLGFQIKATVLISMIAAMIVTAFYASRRIYAAMAAALAVTLALIAAGGPFTSSLPCEQLRDEYGVPKLSYWIGIGLEGNGGYADNLEYDEYIQSIPGIAAREAASWSYIRLHSSAFLEPEHLISKARYNFASGDMGVDDFVHRNQETNLLYDYMSTDGKYFNRFSTVSTVYQYAVYFLVGTGALCAGISGLRRRQAGAAFDRLLPEEFIRHILYLSLFGFVLYLMLFEANNRQLYNQLGVLTCCAVAGLSSIRTTFLKKIK